MRLCRKLRLPCVAVLVLIPRLVLAASDPVAGFIAEADSVYRAGGDSLLAVCVASRGPLVGAAVGQLLDASFEAGQAGDHAGESENVTFAYRVARLHESLSGSAIPLRIVEIFRRWTPEQRATHARTKSLEAEAFSLQKDGEYDRAAALFREVIELSETIDDRRMIAVTWGSLGVVNWYRGDMPAVQGDYERALAARRAVEDRILEGRTLNGLGSVAFRLGKYVEAVGYYDDAVKCRRETGDLGGVGISLTYKGNAYYRMGRLIDARKTYEEAYEVLEDHGSPPQLLEVLNSVANIHWETGRVASSNEAYRRAIEIAAGVDRPQDEAMCRINLAGNLRAQGRYRDALEELDRVPSLLERQPEPEKTALFYRERGQAYREMGELDLSRDDLLIYLEQARKLESPEHQVEALMALGDLYLDLGAYEHALEAAGRADTLAAALGNDRLRAGACALASAVEQGLGRPEEALAYRKLSRERNVTAGADGFVLEDDVAIASFHATLGEKARAREAFYMVLPRVREADRTDLEQAVHFGIGHTYERENPDSAAYHYEKALALIDESRLQAGQAETRSGFFSGESRFLYEEVARYYASLDAGSRKGRWSSRAFHTIERAKARGLLDLLERTVVAAATPAEESILDSLYQMAGDPEEREAKLRLEKRYLALRSARVSGAIERLDPQGGVVGIDDVRRALPRNTALLEYALGDTASLLWVLDRKGFDTFEIPGRGALRVDVERLRDAVGKPGAGDAVLRDAAWNLYDKLVRPARERISRAETLIIVPDDFLFEIPFEILLTEKPKSEADWRDLPYITRSFETVYAPSASIFVKMGRVRGEGKYPMALVAFGDPDFSLVASDRTAECTPLPYSRAEVERIGARLDDAAKKVFVGADASEERLKITFRSGDVPRILHLATHGLADRADPNASHVVLAASPDGGEDGRLHTLEILSLPRGAGLVVLSACESAKGRIGRGEGVVGLSRAFIASGTNAVVASLWAVSDESTAELMGSFYDRMIAKKRSAGGALRAARLSILRDSKYSHPFHWSPFIVIGAASAPW